MSDHDNSGDEKPKKARHTGRADADHALALALAGGMPVEDAAARAGISPATAHRRRKSPAFRELVRDIRRQQLASVVGVLTAGSVEAAQVLRELVRPGTTPAADDLTETPAAVRVSAAKALLECGKQARAEIETDSRLRALEAALGLQHGGPLAGSSPNETLPEDEQ